MKHAFWIVPAAAVVFALSGYGSGEAGDVRVSAGAPAGYHDLTQRQDLPDGHPPVPRAYPRLPEGHPPLPDGYLVCPATGAVSRPGNGPQPATPLRARGGITI